MNFLVVGISCLIVGLLFLIGGVINLPNDMNAIMFILVGIALIAYSIYSFIRHSKEK